MEKLFDRLVGSWLGEGKTNGKSIRDELEWQWAFDRKLLRMYLKSVEGDAFRAEGYLWHNHALGRVELYEFNNGDWPVRIMLGNATRNKLSLEEREGDRHINITIEIENDRILRLTEANITSQGLEPFVEELFQRKTP